MYSARLLGLALSVGALFTSGCSIGPSVLRLNFLRFNEAVSDKENEQFLLNIVKLRYRDPPKSLAIGNINSQFTSEVDGPASLVTGYFQKSQNLLLPVGRFADTPNISMSPLTGADYVTGMVTPVPLDRIVLMAGSGWDLDRLLRVLVHTMNGMENAAHLAGEGGERVPRFVEFVATAKTLARLHHEGLIELSAEPHPLPIAKLSEPIKASEVKASDVINAVGKNYIFESVPDDADKADKADKAKMVVLKNTIQAFNMNLANEAWRDGEIRQAAHFLNLRIGLKKYVLVPGDAGHLERKLGPEDDTILVSTRSVLGAMLYLSRGVNVPAKHYEEGLVVVPQDDAGQPFDWTQVTDGVFHVCVSKFRPRHAFVATEYRGYWYYISDRDLTSKSTFDLVLEMHNVQITKGMTTAPLLTLPVGGGSSVPAR